VIVDNVAPFVDATTPVTVVAVNGGDVFTTHREAHAYFPPGAFTRDAHVTLTPTSSSCAPPAGLTRVDAGYTLSCSEPLGKRAVLELSIADSLHATGSGSPAIYVCVGSAFARLGGTYDPSRGTISLAIDKSGTFAVFRDAGGVSRPTTLGRVAITPRIFSPHGGYASRDVAVGVSIASAGPVTVTVFDRAGHTVRLP